MKIPTRSVPIDYLFLTRPTLLVPVWTILLVGYYRGLFYYGITLNRVKPSAELLYVIIIYSALMGGVYILNQIIDRETDRRNEKLFLLSAGVIPLGLAKLEMVLLMLVPLAFSLFLGVHYCILFAVSLVMGVLYSTPPIRAKGRPVLDLVFNSLGYGMVNFLVGWGAAGAISRSTFVHAVPYCLAVGAVFVNTTIPDIEGDRADGAVTTGVFLGEARTALFGLSLMVAAVLTSLLLRDIVCSVAAACATPFFLVAAVKRNRRWYLRSFRLGAPALVIAAVALFPYYLILLLVTLVSMRVYYRMRFDLAYPSVMSEK